LAAVGRRGGNVSLKEVNMQLNQRFFGLNTVEDVLCLCDEHRDVLDAVNLSSALQRTANLATHSEVI